MDTTSKLFPVKFTSDVFLSSELCQWLDRLSLVRRKALLFALETEIDPRSIIDLSWQELYLLDVSSLARDIAYSMPRHIRLNYVFWEQLPNGSAGPLFGFRESILECADGIGFDAMLNRYRNMLLIDADADLQSFVKELNAELDARIAG